MPRPNIICFVTDQHRADHLGCYGNTQVRTPNIDRLAREGVTFSHSYVCNPVCAPNRASMFTGTYPQRHGLTQNGFALDPCTPVLPQMLSDAGYHTACVGKIHLAPFQIRPEEAEHDWDLYESGYYWNSGGTLPEKYYGFDEVCLVDGHGPYAFGDYKRWLDREHPGEYDKMKRANSLVPPTCQREHWKSAIPKEFHYNTFIGDRTIDFLQRHDGEQPFFLWCSFPDPHHPYSPPRPYCDMYDPADIQFAPARRENEFDDLPDYFRLSYEGKIGTGGLAGDVRKISDDDYRQIIAHTYGMISFVDDQIGRVMKSLEDTGLLENTIVMFMSDHGDLMGDHWLINKGPYLYRGLVRVPTIWRLPNGVNPGHSSDAMISTVDLCPTIMDLAGAAISDDIQGTSYLGVLDETKDRTQESILIEFDEAYIKDRVRQMRTADWALTGFVDRQDGTLFDLKNDPNELLNLWDDPRYAEIRAQLVSEMFERFGPVASTWASEKSVHA